MTFSLKDLCCKSARQIKFYIEHPEQKPQPNANAFAGEAFQDIVAQRLGDSVLGQEMGYSVTDGINTVFFSNDIVIAGGNIVEVKSVSPDRPVEEWYFNNSVLQCAVYYAFTRNQLVIKTSKFYIEQGHEALALKLPDNFAYFLQFGEDKYKINVSEPQRIVDFYMQKANASLDWDTAKEWDEKFKFKEFDVLKKYFTYDKAV